MLLDITETVEKSPTYYSWPLIFDLNLARIVLIVPILENRNLYNMNFLLSIILRFSLSILQNIRALKPPIPLQEPLEDIVKEQQSPTKLKRSFYQSSSLFAKFSVIMKRLVQSYRKSKKSWPSLVGKHWH